MKRVYCDKCGEELTDNGTLHMNIEYQMGYEKAVMDYELCEECVRKVMGYVEDGESKQR